jgi:hypothetical protein
VETSGLNLVLNTERTFPFSGGEEVLNFTFNNESIYFEANEMKKFMWILWVHNKFSQPIRSVHEGLSKASCPLVVRKVCLPPNLECTFRKCREYFGWRISRREGNWKKNMSMEEYY